MKHLVILVCLLVLCSNTYATKTTITGHFRYKPEQSMELRYFATIIDRIEHRETVLETFVEEDRTYSISFDIAQPIQVTLSNGYSDILNYAFIFPGDSIHLYTTKFNTYASGRGSENIDFLFKFAERYSRDSISPWQESNRNIYPFNKKTIEEAAPTTYAKFWESRKNDHINFLKEHLNSTTNAQEFARLFEHEETYNYARKLYEYPGYFRKKHREEARQEPYQSYLKNIPINDTSAWVSFYYLYILSIHTPNWVIPTDDIRDDNNPNTVAYFKHSIKTWDSIAKQQFNPATYQVALYSQLYSSTYNRVNKLRSRIPSDSERHIKRQMIKAHAQLLEQPLRHRIDSFLRIHEGEKAIAPNFTVYDNEGKKVQLTDYKGKIVLLTFWSAKSRSSIGDINLNKKMHKKFVNNKDVVFLYISLDDDKNYVQQLIQERKFSGIHTFSPNGLYADAAKKYGVTKLPRYILVDKKGFIVDNNANKMGTFNGVVIKELLANSD